MTALKIARGFGLPLEIVTEFSDAMSEAEMLLQKRAELDVLRQDIGASSQALMDTLERWASLRPDQVARPVSEPPAEREVGIGYRRSDGLPPVATVPRPRGQSSPGPAAQSNGRLPDAQQRVLNALAWWQAARVGEVSRLQLAMVAGYHPRTNAFTGALAELNDAGHVEFPRAGHVQLRASGSALADHPVDRPRNSTDLQRMIVTRFNDVRADVLRTLLAAEGPLTRVELADALDYHPRTNAFTSALGSLRSLGLIDFPRPGWVEPSPAMYLR